MRSCSPDNQFLVSHDIDGKPFGFIPLTCSLYRLNEYEYEKARLSAPLSKHDSIITTIDALPEIESEFRDILNGRSAAELYRRHTPGIALVVTQSCNLGCSYCLAKQGSFGIAINKMHPSEVIDRIDDLFSQHENIDFIKFFGGEPTLRMDLINDICSHVTKTLGKNVHFALTTNGTGNASKHLETWRKYHISVSVSIDGPREIHDAERKTISGRGSYDQAVAYCNYLEMHEFPYAVVGVFDERHIKAGLSYLETIEFLNKISPLTKVQFVEALGDAAETSTKNQFTIEEAKRQVIEAVDSIWDKISSKWTSPNDKDWLYDNNLFRFAYGVTFGHARPYLHACTASNLTTIMPSGQTMPCYTFSENESLHLGKRGDSISFIEKSRENYQKDFSWKALSDAGTNAPWYRGIVGDICVADMLNSNSPGLETSPFYQAFQEAAVLRTLQNAAAIVPGSKKHARIIGAMEAHKNLTGEYTSKMGYQPKRNQVTMKEE